MAAKKAASTARPVGEIADDLDEIAGSQPGAFSRRLARIAAELRGETLEPTPNEARAAARAEAREAEVDDTTAA